MARLSNKQLYNKELANLKRRLVRLESQGVDITGFELPKVPKKITKQSIERVRNLRGTKLQNQLPNLRGTDTNEESTRGRLKTRPLRGKSRSTDNVSRETNEQYIPTLTMSDVLYDFVDSIVDEREAIIRGTNTKVIVHLSGDKNYLRRAINDRVEQLGADGFEKYLLSKQEEIMTEVTFVNEKAIYVDQVKEGIVKLFTIINDTLALTLEQAQWANDYSDYYNLW